MTHNLSYLTIEEILRLGVTLQATGEFANALALYDEAAPRYSECAPLWNNRGNALLELSRHDEAIESYRHALMLSPGLLDTRIALATCLQAVGSVKEARTECEQVIALAPEHAEAHWNRALLLLLEGDYREGWREYEWRWKKRGFTSPRRNFAQPQWDGRDCAGKTVLIHAEQGFGDTLQFCRYAPLVAAQGAKVILECHPPLTPLLKTLGNGIIVVPTGKPLPLFDLHVPLLSLPLIFGTEIDSIPKGVPYLSAPSDRVPFWGSVMPSSKNLKAGICWSGKMYPDPQRSIPAELLAPLGQLDDVTWYSLQMEEAGVLKPSFQMMSLTSQIIDFGDTAALISRLDLVLSIDTAVAHLAGAMGVQTWVLLPCAADWRWLTDRDDSPWYPTVKIFRQKYRNDWSSVIEKVARELAAFPLNQIERKLNQPLR